MVLHLEVNDTAKMALILGVGKMGMTERLRYINLRYLKEIVQLPNMPTPPIGFTLSSLHFMDYLFRLNNLLKIEGSNLITCIPWKTDKPTKWHIIDEEVYIDTSSGYGNGVMGKVGIAEDVNAIYFICFINGENVSNGGIDLPLTSGFSAEGSFLNDILQPSINWHRD